MELPLRYLNLKDLNLFHRFIDSRFIEHQLHIMHGDMTTAFEHLVYIKKMYIQHAADEEGVLLPLYDRLIKPIPQGGAIEFYMREHRQIADYLTMFIEAIAGWEKNDNPDNPAIVSQFDTYYKFKQLVSHHHNRENNFLYRLLDAKLNDRDKKYVLDKFVTGQKKASFL